VRQAVLFGEIDLSGLLGVLELVCHFPVSNFLNPHRGISPKPWITRWTCCGSTSWTLLTRRSCGCRRSSARVRVGEQCAIRYVAVTSGRVILRPHNAEWPMELVEIGTGRSFAEYIIGRVGHVALRCGGVRTQR